MKYFLSYREWCKFYNRYYSLYEYDYDHYEDWYDAVINIPEDENFIQHVENVRRLLEVEFGGVFHVTLVDRRTREIFTDLPIDLLNDDDYDKSELTAEEIEKIEEFRRYRFTDEITTCEPLW